MQVKRVLLRNVRCALLLAAALAGTQKPSAAAPQGIQDYSVRMWQSDDGLPQNSVFAITQTSDGYLWVGTHEGLARFDGVRFSLLDEKVAPELNHGWITGLCATRDGSLWIACDGYGIAHLSKQGCSHFSQAEGLLSNQTRCLLEGPDGSLWIGTEGGLSRFKDGKFTNFTVKNGLGDNSIRALCQDLQGNLRVATRRGLSSLSSEGNLSTLNFGIGSIANALRCVCVDRQGNVWVGANDGINCAVAEPKDGTGARRFYGLNEGLPDRVTNVIYEDRAGQIWSGTYGGLARLEGSRFGCGPSSEAVFGDLIYTVFEDRENNLWVGARDGLYRLTPARFATYTIQQGLTCNNVMSVCGDESGAIWIGTWGGGLNRLKEQKIEGFSRTNGLTHDMVLSLDQARDGSLWVGMDFDGGLNRLFNGQHESISKQNGLLDAAIRVIHEDGEGRLWIGTSKGLNVLRRPNTPNSIPGPPFIETYTTANGLAGNTILALCEETAAKMWIGTEEGLTLRQDGKFANFTTRDGLSHNTVGALYLEKALTEMSGETPAPLPNPSILDIPHSVLWIGTRGGGLNRFKAGKFTAYTTRQGLFNDEIYEILEDNWGFFWMSCRKGIFRVRKKDFDDLDRGAIKAVTCTAFGKADGLVSVQCNGVAKPAGWKAKDGRLWFPTIRGVVAVQPKIKSNDQPPPVLIEEVLTDKKAVEHGSVGAWDASTLPRTEAPTLLTIRPGRGELEIRYTALSLQAPERNRFKYKLEGIDPTWIDAASRRAAYYNNIAPGRYRFQVIACNNDGVWNETGATLTFLFQPHYWQTWSFKVVLVAATALLLTLFYRARVARLRALERLRIQIAADLHDDVGARLTKVAMVTEFVDRETPSTDRSKPHIQNIARTTREVIQAMDEIVWTINPANDTLDHLANYIFQYAEEYFQNTGVRCRLDLPAQLPPHVVGTEQRHNLFMAVKEALNNVLKHAGATDVRISLAVTDSRLAITIADNGRGFLLNGGPPTGDGLVNMKQRLARIGGHLTLETQPGDGTRVRMEVESG